LRTGQKETVMAASAGEYSEQQPGAALAVHFRCTWSHSLPSDFDKRIAVVPDGCSDIIWSRQGLFVAGPDRSAAFPPLQAGETVIGMRFQPGAAARWLKLSMAEITGQTVALADLWGADGSALHERLSGKTSTTERLALLQGVLEQRTANVTAPSQAMRRTFEHLTKHNGGGAQAVESLPRALGYGERTFRRHCLEHFGYGPKTLDRILRFQRLLSLLRTNRLDALSILAVDAGYADQAHMCREVRMLSGFSPGEIRQQAAV
jgi:AraC-like DNA-binding protein